MGMRFVIVVTLAAWPACAEAATDGAYRSLRDAAPFETRRVENIELKRDVGLITLTSGQITFFTPAMNRVTLGVFSGEGRFRLKPAPPRQAAYMASVTGKSEADEAFDSAAFYFTDQTYDEIRGQSQTMTIDARAPGVLRDFRRRLRRDVETPKSLVEEMFSGESASNLEAELLSELYTPAGTGSFRLFLHGKREADLRFLVVPRGALPMLPAAEEVALLNDDPGGERDGVWYLSHRREEGAGDAGPTGEDHRVVVAGRYQIENTIASNAQLAAKATIQFNSNVDGLRVVPFGLLPSLRVSSVTGETGAPLAWVQEPLREDAAFYVILPEPLARGKPYQIQVAYEGNRVIRKEDNGNFSVGARTSWYPSLNSFLDRAAFDLTFKVPKEYTVVSVGKLARDWTERNLACTQWISDAPLAVAGFNYGAFKKKQVFDKESGYNIEVYATPDVPDYLRRPPRPPTQDRPGDPRAGSGLDVDFTMTPSAMADKSLADAQNSIRLFQHWFGKTPYGRIAITQQPEPNFGQSWPSLVYLPVTAFLDATQRYLLLQQISRGLTDFIQEVTPHEVAHQWWGHMVGWKSFHDQWLSEGFAEFSAGLFIEATKPSEAEKFWQRLRDEIIQKNEFGNAPNDAGPLWLGQLLNTSKNPGAYNRLVYPKGAYILHMLRMLMRDAKTGDQDFMAMMQDYAASYQNRNASSEDFKSVVEKHMTPVLDLEGNRRMDWFYRDWIYGTELPKYRLDYSLKPADGGKVTFQGKVTQSSVSPGFRMRVPVYLDFDGRWIRLGTVGLEGNTTAPEITVSLPKRPRRVSLNAANDVLAAEVVTKEN